MTLTTVLKGPLILSHCNDFNWGLDYYSRCEGISYFYCSKWRLILCCNFGLTLYLIFCYLFSLNEFWAFYAHIRYVILYYKKKKRERKTWQEGWKKMHETDPTCFRSQILLFCHDIVVRNPQLDMLKSMQLTRLCPFDAYSAHGFGRRIQCSMLNEWHLIGCL